jgi:multiple sugar transport system permease protein
MNKNTKYSYLFLAPWIVSFLLFWLYPLIYSFLLSFGEYKTLTNELTLIGFDNYIKLLYDPYFHQALLNTFIFTFGTVPVTCLLSLFFAVQVNEVGGKFQEWLKSAFFIPSVTSLVVISLIFTNLYSGNGYINSLLEMLNLPYPEKGWLLEPSTSLLSIMLMDIWMSIGYYMLIFMSYLQTIPQNLYSVADLEGMKKSNQFWKITIPLMKPAITFVLIINTIKSFQVFVEVYVMTKGGPLGSSNTLVYAIFDKAFNQFDQISYSSAIAYMLFFILIILSLVQMKLLKSE